MKIGVLGGGLAGLTVGSLLKEKGYEIEVLEAEEKVGGLCRSETTDGFVFDIGGGHIIYSKDKEILGFMLKNIGEKNVVQHKRNTKIFYKDCYVKYPFENGLNDLPKEDNFACLIGYIKAYYARQDKESREPRNFKEWIVWRFGEEIAKRFMFPYNEKIWNANLETMDVDWVKGRVPDSPFEEIVKASLGIPSEGYIHQSTFYYPVSKGMQSFLDSMATKIKGDIKINKPVMAVEKKKEKWIVNGVEYDAVVSTIPIHELIKALKNTNDKIKRAVSQLKYISIATFLIGLDQPNTKPYSWVYLPHKEHGPCNRVTWFSNYSPNNAPEGKSSLLAEVTYSGGTELKIDKTYIQQIIDSLHSNGMLDRNEVCFTAWKKLKYAYMLFDLNYKRNTTMIYKYLEKIGLPTVGRFATFKYLNMDHVIKEAMELVRSKF